MIEGVRALPWLWIHERLGNQDRRFDCDSCMGEYTRQQRRHKRCGLIPEAEWLPLRAAADRRTLATSEGVEEFDTCPGYTSTMPQVIDAARNWGHWSKGQLGLKYPDGIDCHDLDLVELFNSQHAASESFYVDQVKKRSEK